MESFDTLILLSQVKEICDKHAFEKVVPHDALIEILNIISPQVCLDYVVDSYTAQSLLHVLAKNYGVKHE